MSPYSAKTLKPRGWIHPEKRRPNSAARGYGYAWRRIRARVLADNPICTKCWLAPSNTVDHRLSRSKGGTDDPSNLQAMCHECHSRKTVHVDDRWGER